MANTTSAKKAQRAAEKRRIFNARRKKTMRDAVRSVEKMVAAKNASGAAKLLPEVYQAIDKASKRGTIKPNTASRMKSRLSKQVSSLAK